MKPGIIFGARDAVLEWMKGRLEHYWNMDVVACLEVEEIRRNLFEKGWVCLKRRGN